MIIYTIQRVSLASKVFKNVLIEPCKRTHVEKISPNHEHCQYCFYTINTHLLYLSVEDSMDIKKKSFILYFPWQNLTSIQL